MTAPLASLVLRSVLVALAALLPASAFVLPATTVVAASPPCRSHTEVHTYFVAGDVSAPAVWVHNMCEPTADYVYRVLRQDEIPSAFGRRSLAAKNPGATYSPMEHVLRGSEEGFQSQWLSATRDEKFARVWAKKNGTVYIRLDLKKVNTRTVDLSDAAVRRTHFGDPSALAPGSDGWKANKFSRGAKEVLIEGEIPGAALVDIHHPF